VAGVLELGQVPSQVLELGQVPSQVQARELGHILVPKQDGKNQTNVQINHIVFWDNKYSIQRDHMVVVPLASIPELGLVHEPARGQLLAQELAALVRGQLLVQELEPEPEPALAPWSEPW
jgi:hypothetical protein